MGSWGGVSQAGLIEYERHTVDTLVIGRTKIRFLFCYEAVHFFLDPDVPFCRCLCGDRRNSEKKKIKRFVIYFLEGPAFSFKTHLPMHSKLKFKEEQERYNKTILEQTLGREIPK